VWTCGAVRPDHEDNSIAPESKPLEPLLSIRLASVFVRDHRGVEGALKLSDVDSVVTEVDDPLRGIPGDHRQIVYTPRSLSSEVRGGSRSARV